MADQNQNEAEIVTIKEAVDKVKKWADEKDYEKVKEGSEEILEVEPDNADVKKLLADAEAALGGASAIEAVPAAPATPTEPEPVVEDTPEPTPEAPSVEAIEPVTSAEPAKEEEPLKVDLVEDEAPASNEPENPEPEVAPEPAPMDDSMPDFSKKEEEKPENAEVVDKLPEIEPKKKGGAGKIVLVVVLLAILAGLVYAYLQGLLNPVLDYILGLLGL